MRMNVAMVAGLLLGTVLVGAACDDDGAIDGAIDGATLDSGPVDSGSVDGATRDSGTDSGVVLCAGAICATGQACVRDVCIDTCGADTSGWDAALSPSLTVVRSFCRDAAAFGTNPNTTPANTVFDLTVTAGAGSTDLGLSSWTIAASGDPSPMSIGSVTVTHDAADLLFPNAFVRADDLGQTVLFGYTLSSAGFAGEVFRVARADGMSAPVNAPGSFDAAWLTADTFLVNGLGLATLTGPGVYAGRIDSAGAVVASLIVRFPSDSSSGSVVVGPDYVVFGEFRADFSSAVYVASRTSVEAAAAAAPLDLATDTVRVGETMGLPSSFALVHDQLVVSVFDPTFMFQSLIAHPVTAYDSTTGLTLGSEVTLTTLEMFSAAYGAESGDTLLRFPFGLLWVR